MEAGELTIGEAVAAAADGVAGASVDVPEERRDVAASEAGASAGPSGTGEGAMEPRPQAEPLPLKRGELGFQERYQQQLAEEDAPSEETQSAQPSPHPVDGSAPSAASEQPSVGASSADTDSEANAAHPACDSSNKRFTSKQLSSLGGVHLHTLLLLILQIVLICATIAGWVLFGIFSSSKSSSSNSSSNSSNSIFGASSSQIFGHVLFTIALLAQLVFLERRIYYLRAERYCYANPGLPLHGRGRGRAGRDALGFAPWSRPPLPTYAAALAQSGVGTGDVEDNLIAVAPPPAYGNTRGSTLLLSGLISDTLRREQVRGGGAGTARDSRASDRPVSYASHDEEWEERCNAMRALTLEDTLARLEDARVTTQDGELRRGASPA